MSGRATLAELVSQSSGQYRMIKGRYGKLYLTVAYYLTVPRDYLFRIASCFVISVCFLFLGKVPAFFNKSFQKRVLSS